MRNWMQISATAILILGFAGSVTANTVRVAVASNFSIAMRSIAPSFEARTGYKLTPVLGSTGKLYAQIVNGAPIDIFLAADSDRPKKLEDRGTGIRGSRFTYAIGQLVLWSPLADFIDPDGAQLETGNFRYLAIANPRLAPYGRAAQQVLELRALNVNLAGRIITGENISQTYQFVASGNAQLGFIALSQVTSLSNPEIPGSLWRIPPSLYDAIEQQAVLLKDTPAALAFLEFLQGDEARDIIVRHGYAVP